jgi:5-methylcytosine-specific restriction endonuclease McrBC regulatory subunit McrC
MRTTDNNGGKSLAEIGGDNSSGLSAIANKSLFELRKDNPDLLVYPQELGMYNDDIGKSHICSLYDDKLTTYNLMGFVGKDDTQLTISSRFTQNEPRNNRDYFLHYMLGKVLSLNIVNLDTAKDTEGIEDFLPYLFPAYLKSALSQGIFKEYRHNEYNNANIRGIIDTSRHIRLNVPFAGKIAYNTREYSYDNTMTELIRHTIEYLRTTSMATVVLTASPSIRSHVQIIIDCTRSYSKNDKQKIINANLKPIHHPYYTEYLPLQRLCLQILRNEKVSFGIDKDKIHGLLFDGAWLWEEYLNSILKKDFSHPRNKTKEGTEYLFKGQDGKNKQKIYPDFISHDKTIIADAKYKHLECRNEEYGRDDYFQIITYMYRFLAKNGFLLFPHPDVIFCEQYSIIDTEGRLTKIGLAIPQHIYEYKSFCQEIDINEKNYIDKLKELRKRG